MRVQALETRPVSVAFQSHLLVAALYSVIPIVLFMDLTRRGKTSVKESTSLAIVAWLDTRELNPRTFVRRVNDSLPLLQGVTKLTKS